MKLLHPIYSNPAQLLDKAKRDGASLIRALEECDEQEVRDVLFNFAITAYHIWDWIRAYRPELDQQVTALLNDCEAIAACRDLSNASKHVVLTLDRGAYAKYPPVIEEVSISAITQAPILPMTDALGELQNQMNVASPPWRLKVHLVSGRRVRAEDLVAEVLNAWDRFFKQHAIG